MNLPAPYHASGSYLRDAFRRVHERLGGDDRLLQEANRSPQAYWEFQKLNVKQQPKEVQLQLDNSAEALLEALEARKRGEEIQYIDEQQRAIEADYVVLPKTTLWSPKVAYSTRV